MDVDQEQLGALIGDRVRRERQSRGWTLDRLAEASGVSRRLVVSIEQGDANPSIASLLRLSGALGVGLPALVEPPAADRVQVVRHGGAPVLWRGNGGGSASLVASTGAPDVVELWDWRLGAGERYASEAHTRGTTELLQVVEGAVTVEVGNAATELGRGDAIRFPGDLPHAYGNPGAEAARFSLAVFEPDGVGASRSHG